MFKYLAVWESCQLNTDEKKRRRLITGVLLITLHLTYQFSNVGLQKGKLHYLKWQGDYVISTANMSHPGSDDNDNGPHLQFNFMGWFFPNEFTSCAWHDTCITHLKAHKIVISQILKYRGERVVQQLFNTAQSSCTEQGIRESLVFNWYARQCLKHKNRKWPIWMWL